MEDEDRKLAFCRDAYPKIVGAVALYCGRVDVAEDAAQEALARVCDSPWVEWRLLGFQH